MTSLGKPVARQSRTTSAIGSSSFNAGMITDTFAAFIPGPARRARNKRPARKNRSRRASPGRLRFSDQVSSQCRNDGTLNPNKQAMKSETVMVRADDQTRHLHRRAKSRRSRRREFRTPGPEQRRHDFAAEILEEPLRVSAFTRNAWIVSVIDCMLTLSLRPSTMVRKNAMTRLLASVASKAPARNAQTVPAATVASSQGKR